MRLVLIDAPDLDYTAAAIVVRLQGHQELRLYL